MASGLRLSRAMSHPTRGPIADGVRGFARSATRAGAAANPRSWTVDLEAARRGVGNGMKVVGINGEDEIVASKRTFHDGHVDDVGGPGAGRERADGACLVVAEGFNVAPDKQPRQ